MMFLFDISLPFKDPVLVFSVVLFIIFFAPLVLKKFRIPGIIGLILSGVIVGPNGFNLLLRNSGIVLFGTVGLLYIMFLAGLEIDLNDFKKNRNKSLIFGGFTFFIPLTLGTFVSYYILHLNIQGSVLLASMFASHTLVSYPIASKLGLTKKQAVTLAIGGTIITDTAVLLLLAVITGSVSGNLDTAFWVKLSISLVIFGFVVLFVFPKVTKWFFKNVQGDGGAQYIFVLGIVFAAAFLSEVAGVEPIIGAFLAGLALNRLIPHTSPLMNRIEFIGNTLFIPFFLISVGMIVDVKVLFNGYQALFVAGVLIVLALFSKWAAAFITQKIFKFSSIERNLIFGLSSSHAAATLAVILVGFDLKLFDEAILNGTILLILVTCMVSSFVTESAGRKLAIAESKGGEEYNEIEERILIAITNPASIESKIDMAAMLKESDKSQPIYAVSVVNDDEEARDKLIQNKKMVERAIKHAASAENKLEVVSRIDLNIANGIARAVKELMITEVIIGWHEKNTTTEKLFGTVLENLVERTDQMIVVSRTLQPLNTISKIFVMVPPNAELEIGFKRWVHMVKKLSKQINSQVIFFGVSESLQHLKKAVNESKPGIEADYKGFSDWDDFPFFSGQINEDDLFIAITARKATLSHTIFMDSIPKILQRHFEKNNFMLVYPEQFSEDPENRNLQLDGMTTTMIREDLQRFNKIGKLLKGVIKWRKK
ncbi:MAG: cation:proton antiporter [Sporocytophaga sp.]|uniref:cation:proton antiporter n=1 Tax=Sporocytophaga sp. TaxID=2231183 RepID=UPI001B2C9A4A|nr:cation:proton antiporter [Sporocytophaga sp.]MBO9699877.1 cation:proton antiporter [Sporocytophaga sp.]